MYCVWLLLTHLDGSIRVTCEDESSRPHSDTIDCLALVDAVGTDVTVIH